MRYCALHKNWYAFDYCPDCLATVIPVLDSNTIDPEHLSIDQPAEAYDAAEQLLNEQETSKAEPLKPDDQDELWEDIRNEMFAEWIRISRAEKGVRSAMDILKSKYTITRK